MSQYKNFVNKYSEGKAITDAELKNIQKGLVYLLKEIMEVCDKYDIKPFLVGGNLLGKIRHNGFIPWDDDLDLGMLREDYDKFITIFDKELSDRYVISAPFKGYQATNRFIQLGRKGTVLQSSLASSDSESIAINHLYIDVFPYDYVPDNVILRTIKGLRCNIYMAIAGAVSFKKEKKEGTEKIFQHSLKGKAEYAVRMIVGTLFGFRSVTNWMIAVNKVATYKKKGRYISGSLGRKHYFGEIVATKDILPFKQGDYCGVEANIMNNPDAYLRSIYGDYMQVPPPEKRESHQAVKIYIPDEILK